MQTALVRWLGSEKFLGQTPSGHAVPFDSDRNSNSAPGPMEMLLVALGACTATDVVSILAKKRQHLESLEIVISGERAPSPPAVWVKLELLYKLRGRNASGGPLDEKAVRDAITLSKDKYCSVSATLAKSAHISFRHEILSSTSS